MVEPHKGEYRVQLSIARFGVSLQCGDPALARELAQRYQGISPGQGTALTARLDISPSRSSTSLLDLPVNFDHGVLACTAPECRLSIDPGSRLAKLEMEARDPQVQADYFLRLALALLAYEAGGLLFHAAAVVRNSLAVAFYGSSGSGKSTVARVSAEGTVLNDDLVLLMPNENRWDVHATPFWNQGPVNIASRSAPLGGLFRLVQDRSVDVEPLSVPVGVAEILASLPVVTADPERTPEVIHRCQDILAKIPSYRLHFLPDASFWAVVDAELERVRRETSP